METDRQLMVDFSVGQKFDFCQEFWLDDVRWSIIEAVDSKLRKTR